METLSLKVKELTKNRNEFKTKENLTVLYSCIDLTNLNSYAKTEDIKNLCNKALFSAFEGKQTKQVATICVYPTYINLCKVFLEGSEVVIASVAGGFPHAQAYPEVKYLETELAIKHGAAEIEMVIRLSSFLSGDESLVFDEIKMIKQACGGHLLKVILEADLLKEKGLIAEASAMSLEAGADFIVTSSGKDGSYASPEAVYIMCNTIKKRHEKTGLKAGLKASGGVVSTSDALGYYAIVREVLGKEWLTPKLFRLGANNLAVNLLNDIARG